MLMVPLLADAVALITIVAGSGNTCPGVGLVILTAGGDGPNGINLVAGIGRSKVAFGNCHPTERLSEPVASL